MGTFDFQPLQSTVEIKLAFAYSPKILCNRIVNRQRTGLLFVAEGEYIYSFAQTSFRATPGSMVYLPPKAEPYEYKILSADATTQVYQLDIDFAEMGGLGGIALSAHPNLITDFNAEEIRKMFEMVIQNQRNQSSAARFYVQSVIYRLLSICAEGIGTKDSIAVDSKIFPAVKYVSENYKAAIEVKDLADMCYISESQLRRLFLKEIGLSPLRYKSKLLIDDACRLLKNSELSISEISNVLGFSDAYAFSHAFKKEKGMSPKAYRNT